jgi:hypothetical protein
MADQTITVTQLLQTTQVQQGFGSSSTGGLTTVEADARYIKRSEVDQPHGVAGLDANKELTQPQPLQWNSTNW